MFSDNTIVLTWSSVAELKSLGTAVARRLPDRQECGKGILVI